MTATGTDTPGIYGKLPSHGDFLTRGLPQSFVSPWDLWLQQALVRSQESIGAEWLRHYLVGPIWRFVLTPGITGQDAWTGLLMPSVDKVERYFPLTLACRIANDALPFSLIDRAADWFNRAEALMLDWLEHDADGATVDQARNDLGPPPLPAVGVAASQPAAGVQDAWRVALTAGGRDGALHCQSLLHKSLSDQFFAYSLWWSQGAQTVSPSLLLCQGLPPPEGFSAMLDGDWQRDRWQQFLDTDSRTSTPSSGAELTDD